MSVRVPYGTNNASKTRQVLEIPRTLRPEPNIVLTKFNIKIETESQQG